MFEMTRQLVISGIRSARPEITEAELRQGLLLRYYADELSPEQRERILTGIADYWARWEARQQHDVQFDEATIIAPVRRPYGAAATVPLAPGRLLVWSRSSRTREAAAISWTAASNASWFTRAGFRNPLIFRTYCKAAS